MILVVWAAAAIAASSVGAFNLNCSGTSETIVPGQFVHTTEPYALTYRIDLGRRKWCADECRALFDIQEVSPGMLVLAGKDVDTPREHEVMHRAIDRATGEEVYAFTYGVGSYEATTERRGVCVKAPFTGFPSVKAKF